MQVAKEYGPVFSVRKGSERLVFISGHQMVKEALVNQLDSFVDRPIVPLFHVIFKGLGECLNRRCITLLAPISIKTCLSLVNFHETLFLSSAATDWLHAFSIHLPGSVVQGIHYPCPPTILLFVTVWNMCLLLYCKDVFFLKQSGDAYHFFIPSSTSCTLAWQYVLFIYAHGGPLNAGCNAKVGDPTWYINSECHAVKKDKKKSLMDKSSIFRVLYPYCHC